MKHYIIFLLLISTLHLHQVVTSVDAAKVEVFKMRLRYELYCAMNFYLSVNLFTSSQNIISDTDNLLHGFSSEVAWTVVLTSGLPIHRIGT